MPSQQNQYTNIADALIRVEAQKQLYESKLVGKNFLYVFIDSRNKITYREVKFERKHFLHLTGLDYKHAQASKRSQNKTIPTYAEEFYNRLGNDESLINDVSFIKGKNSSETKKYFKYTLQKLNNLSQLTVIANKAEFIGNYNGQQNFDIIINRNFNAIAFKKENDQKYIPVSSLYGEAEKVATDIHPILAIFEKCSEFDLYRLNFLNADIKIGKRGFSDEFIELLHNFSFDNEKVKFKNTSLADFKSAYNHSVKKYLSEKLIPVEKARFDAYKDDELMNYYILSFNSFITILNTDLKIRTAIEILNDQSGAESEQLIIDLINSELKEVEKKLVTN